MRLVLKHLQVNGKGQGKIQYTDIKSIPYIWNPEESKDDTMDNFPLVLDYNLVKKAKEDYKRATDFVLDYTSGAQYSKNFPSVIFFEDEKMPSMLIEKGKKPLPTLIYSGDGSYYNRDNNVIGYDPFLKVEGFEDLVAILVHELGHYLDKNYKDTHTLKYPNIGLSLSTINRLSFDKSKSFLGFKKFLDDLNIDSLLFLKNPEYYYEYEHDGMPSESYADLLAARYLLKNAGIYDSNSKMDWETRKKISNYIKEHPSFRLFLNFDDLEIPYMLQYISKHNTQKNKQTNPDLT